MQDQKLLERIAYCNVLQRTNRGSGGALWAPPVGSVAEPQPKSNLVHFSHKIWLQPFPWFSSESTYQIRCSLSRAYYYSVIKLPWILLMQTADLFGIFLAIEGGLRTPQTLPPCVRAWNEVHTMRLTLINPLYEINMNTNEIIKQTKGLRRQLPVLICRCRTF